VEVYTLAWHKTTHVAALGAHRVVVSEFGEGAAISQRFTMASDGFRAVRILLSAPEGTEVTFDWAISEEQTPKTFAVIAKDRATRRTTSEDWQTIAFAPIAKSASKTYRLDIRRVGAPSSSSAAGAAKPAVGLVGSRDHLSRAWLTVGNQDRWGEVVFETEADGDTILGRFMLLTAPTLPAPLRHPVIIWGLFGLYNLALAVFVIVYWPRRPEPTPVTRSTPTRHVGAAVVSLLLVAALVGAFRERRPRSIDLIERMYEAELRSSPLTMRDTFELMPEGLGDSVASVFAHSNSQIRWPMTLPEKARLRTAVVIHPGAWAHAGDGVVFRIGIADDGRYRELFLRHADPARVVADRGWVPVDLDLSAFGGKRVDLIFRTDASVPGQPLNSDYDWAMWGAPRVEY